MAKAEMAKAEPASGLTLGSLSTPLGTMVFASDAAGVLWASDYGDHQHRLRHLLTQRAGGCDLIPGPVPPATQQAIAAYFAGDLAAIDALSVRLNGSDFQNRAWAALRSIPPGSPVSYGRQAELLGNRQAARAVGHANHCNPYNLIVPCHRVLGARGELTGYAGGLERKSWLLDHESRYARHLR